MAQPKPRVVLEGRPARALALGGERVFFLCRDELRSARKDGTDEIVHGAAIDGDRLLAADAGGSVVLWRAPEGVTLLDLGVDQRTVLPAEASVASAAAIHDRTAVLGTREGGPSLTAWSVDSGARRWTTTAAQVLAESPIYANDPIPDAIVGIGWHAEGRFVAWSDSDHTFLTNAHDGRTNGAGKGETLALAVSANGFDVFTVSSKWIVSRAQARVVGQSDFASLTAIAADLDRVFLVLATANGAGQQLVAHRTSGAGKRSSVLATLADGRFTAIAADETALFAATSEEEILGWEGR